jgi:TolB protein
MPREQELTFILDGDIYAVRADGSLLRNLTRHPDPANVSAYSHSWSPDGQRIAYVTRHGLHLIEPEVTSSVHLSGGVGSPAPAWSPNNMRIAFRGYHGLWAINRTGDGLTEIVNDGTYRTPRWWPATRIAFVYTPPSNDSPDLYVVNADGTGLTNLTNTPEHWEWRPRWSPDGTRIAFLGPAGLEVVAVDDGSRTVLTGDLMWLDHHAWSPDGTKLAVTGWRDNNADIYLVDAAGGGEVAQLTEHPASDYEPVWIGIEWIAFQSDREEYYEIYVMNADGTGQTRITDLRLRPSGPSLLRRLNLIDLQLKP